MTGICVCGLGKPARMSSRRSHVSFGDWAPGSARSMAVRARWIPRRPAYRRTSVSTSVTFTSLARSRSSIAATASPIGYQHPKSRAVRAAVVTGMPLTRVISSSSIRSPHAQTWQRVHCRADVKGAVASTHGAVQREADSLRHPRRRDHSHPASAGQWISSVPGDVDVTEHLHIASLLSLDDVAVATASLPTNGSRMTAAFHDRRERHFSQAHPQRHVSVTLGDSHANVTLGGKGRD